MAGTSVSNSQNSSQSQSTTGVLDYPERSFLDSIAQYAGQVGENVYNWAQGAYAKNSSLTDANISNYLTTSQAALTQGANLQNEFQNHVLPAAHNEIAEGNNYASDSRQAMDMGAAESAQMQGNEAALNSHKRDLQSYGIDPSAGRYAGLDQASKVSAAASAVGSAMQARQFDITTGQNLRNRGLTDASQAASAENAGVINDFNTGLQGFAGAENAGLANANTGVSLMGAANAPLGIAASYKPVVGTNSSSSSQGTSSGVSQTTDPASSSGDKSGSGSGGSGNGGAASDPMYQAGQGGNVGGSGASVDQVGDQTGGYSQSDYGSYDPFSSGSGVDYGGYGDNGVGGSLYNGDPFSSAYGNDSIGGSYDAGSSSSLGSYGGGYSSDYGSGFGNDTGAMDYGGGSSDGGYFAQGGAIDDGAEGAIPQDGGTIPTSASPSGGQQVDDVPAQTSQGHQIHVNAGEFVVPNDVIRWKGEEFFQKLIAQSRQARVTAPAKPSQGMRQ